MKIRIARKIIRKWERYIAIKNSTFSKAVRRFEKMSQQERDKMKAFVLFIDVEEISKPVKP
jgi:hypothetical protein